MTQVLEEESILKLKPEEIKRMSEVLAEALVKSPEAIIDYEVTCGVVYYEPYVETLDLDLLASSTAGVTDPLGQLKDWLVSQFETIRDLIISGVTSWVDELWTYTIKPILDGVSWRLYDVWTAIQGIGDVIYDAIVENISKIVDALEPILAPIKDTVNEIWGRISDVVTSEVMSAITFISDWFTTIKDFFTVTLPEFFTDTLPSWMSEIRDFFTVDIPEFFGKVADFFSTTFPNLTTVVTDFFTKTVPDLFTIVTDFFTKTLPDLFDVVVKFFTETFPTLVTPVTDFFTKTLPSLFDVIVKFFTETVPSLFTIVTDFFTKTLPGLFDVVVKFFTETFPSMVTPVTDFFTKTLPSLFDVVVKFFTETFPTMTAPITDFFTKTLPSLLGQVPKVFEETVIPTLVKIPDYLYDYVVAPIVKIPELIDAYVVKYTGFSIAQGFNQLGVTITGFINAILQFPNWFPAWFENHISKPIVDGISELPLVQIFASPQVWVTATLTPSLPNIGTAIWEGTQWLWGQLVSWGTSAINVVWETTKKVTKTLAELMTGAFEFLWNSLKDVGGAIQKLVTPIYEEVSKSLQDVSTKTLQSLFATGSPEVAIIIPKWLEIKEVQVKLAQSVALTFPILFFPFWGTLGVRAIAWALRGAGRHLYHLIETGRLSARPFGVGVLAGFNPWRAIASSFYEIAERVEKGIDTITTGLTYGLAIWFSQPIARVLNYGLRDFLPIQIPQEPQIIEFCRRSMEYNYEKLEPTERFARTLDFAKYYAGLMGYPEETLRWFFSYAKEDWINITDRFKATRKFPMSLMHELPSPSDLARMMVRDMFGPPEFPLPSFERAMAMRGMAKDIAHMYYMLHFRYPPPEKLWEFTVRGISGLLWVTLPEEEKKEIKQEADALKAHIPCSPTKLNFQASPLLRAFKLYMKWHDMARFAWIGKEQLKWEDNFTSDNLIRIDTLADIPTKIDQRWMVKWGLYDSLAKAGVKYQSPVNHFVDIVTEGEPPKEVKRGIYMELDNFCRTLQATGLHPYWVPVVAVAEAMNTLADERTLLRTGFINLFKEGFWNLPTIEKLMEEFVIANFGVVYFDMATLAWKRGYVKQPVMFLPAERKLLELRALMDRALDILRDVARDVARGYSEWIIADEKEYKKRLTDVINKINEWFTKDIKDITGRELRLEYAEKYFESYIKGLGVYRDVFVVRRIRYWTQRWLGYAMYRLATGVTKKEDIEELASYVAEYAKLTEDEKNFISGVIDRMCNIAVKDYIPTPSQLATLSEYMVVSENLITQAFEERRVPENWRKLWKDYISVRPVADDIKALLTTWRRVLRYGKIPEDLEKQVKEYAKKINFTEEEWKILELRATLEEMVSSRKEYVPPLSTLATWAEYMTIPEDLIKKVFEVRMVAKEWQSYWKKYIDVRPIADDVRGLLTTYRRALVYVTVPEDIKKKVEEYAKLIGFTEKEFEILHLRVQLEELIQTLRTTVTLYIPTPTMLATLSEYITLPSKLIDKALAGRGVPTEWMDVWKKYISVRPIKSDAKSLLSAYIRALRYGAVLKEEVDKFIEELPTYGFTPKEIEFITKRVELEETIIGIREQRAEYIPTPSMLATIVEYVPKAREFFDEVMKARRVPKEWQPIWAEYIDLRPIITEVRRYVSRAEDLFVYLAIDEEAYKKVLDEVKKFGYTDKEIELMLTSAQYEMWLRSWRELIGDVDRMVSLSEYSPRASKYALMTLDKMIKALPIPEEEKNELRAIWEEYIKNRPVKSEARSYIYQLINLYVDGLITEDVLKKELEEMKKWGFSDNEIMFYEAQASLRKARKLRIPIGG